MWLYIPRTGSTSSASAPAAAASTSASNWQFPALAQSAWSRGKPSRSRDWYRRWRRASWLQQLCGAMPDPSTADAGAASWMASLAASRASPTVSPASVWRSSMSETCGQPPGASSSSRAPGSYSSKMSAACSHRGGASGYGETFADWATRLRRDYSRRLRSARAMSGNVSSSSRWPTPDASVANDGEMPEAFLARRERVRLRRLNGNGMGTPLAMASKLWFTPSVPNGGRRLPEEVSPTGVTVDGRKRQVGLENQTRLWPTPTSRDHRSIHASPATVERNARPLSEMVGQWPTPRAGDGEKGGPNQAFGTGSVPLPALAARWRTPRAKEDSQYQYAGGNKSKPSPTLLGQAFSHPAQATSTLGEASCSDHRTLNPRFVEWLMGWPPAWTNCECSATEWSRWSRLMRCALSSLGSPPAAPPAQLSLLT